MAVTVVRRAERPYTKLNLTDRSRSCHTGRRGNGEVVLRCWVWVVWVGLLVGRAGYGAEPVETSEAALWGDVERLHGKVDNLRAAGQAPGAIAACEVFLNAHPDAGYITSAAVDMVYSIAFKE